MGRYVAATRLRNELTAQGVEVHSIDSPSAGTDDGASPVVDLLWIELDAGWSPSVLARELDRATAPDVHEPRLRIGGDGVTVPRLVELPSSPQHDEWDGSVLITGGLTALFHLAGPLRIAPSRVSTTLTSQRSSPGKADGAQIVAESIHPVRLRTLVFFSSAAAVLRSAGQANYAAANGFLDGLVLRRSLHTLDRAEWAERLLAKLRSLVAEVLGDADAVESETEFTDMGVDSIMAIDMRTHAEEGLGVELSATVVLDHPTPKTLSEYLVEFLDGDEVPEKAGHGGGLAHEEGR
ncbi:beta-ketoacyl reductase [Nocardiopsis gilva]